MLSSFNGLGLALWSTVSRKILEVVFGLNRKWCRLIGWRWCLVWRKKQPVFHRHASPEVDETHIWINAELQQLNTYTSSDLTANCCGIPLWKGSFSHPAACTVSQMLVTVQIHMYRTKLETASHQNIGFSALQKVAWCHSAFRKDLH